MKIAILGAGRLGRSLAALLPAAGHSVELLGRGDLPGPCDLVLLAVPDAAIPSVAASLPLGPPVLHCSGATEVDALAPHRPRGSLHPLMTFPGPEIALPGPGTPAAIAGDPEAVALATALAHDLGWRAFEVSGDRALYHCAAVMAGNFGTVLLLAAAELLAEAGAPRADAPALLAPLALASLQNAARAPERALTGPFARGDEPVIAAHRASLARRGDADLAALYDALAVHARRLAAAQRAGKTSGD